LRQLGLDPREVISAQLDIDRTAFTIVDAEQPPLRVFLGSFPLTAAERVYKERLETWRAWREVSEAAQG
jgi:hypothetical protein